MRASVVLPVKNGAPYLRELLPALSAQVLDGGLDVLAVDSGSSDESLAVLSAHGVRTLQIPPEPGLTDVLAGKLGLSDVLVQTDLENLVVLPPGAPGPHVPELLTSAAPAHLISTITERYPNHVIVMDTPPCLASTDPTALAVIARQVVFVVEATHTQQPEIESALNMISGCSNISLLLNLVPDSASEHFGSYSYYYQGPEK